VTARENGITCLYIAILVRGGVPIGADFAEDAKSATFRLRDNIHFHDGAPVTPDDVKWTSVPPSHDRDLKTA
jgi:hypothetical protein